MAKLELKQIKVQSFITNIKEREGGRILAGSGCPYVCIGEATFTLDPNGCLSVPQIICDDPYGVTREHAGC